MQAIVYFTLSQVGQKDAIRRNLPAARIQSISGGIDEKDLALMTINAAGEMYSASEQIYVDSAKSCGLAIRGTIYPPSSVSVSFDAVPAGIRQVLDAMHAAIAVQAAKRDQKILDEQARAKESLDNALAQAQANETDTLNSVQYVSLDSAWPNYASLHDHPAHQLRRARIAAREERIARERKEKEVAEAAKETAKALYIAQWIAEHGDESQRARFADGLLCRDEIVSAIAASILDPLGNKFNWRTCGDSDHECFNRSLDCLDAESYAAWSVLRDKLPEGATWEFEEIAPCLRSAEPESYQYCDPGDESNDVGQEVVAVTLTVTEGPFTFKRTVVL